MGNETKEGVEKTSSLKNPASKFLILGIIGFLVFVGLTLSDSGSQQINLSQAIEGDIFLINEGGFSIMHEPMASTSDEKLQRNIVAGFIPGTLFEVLDSQSKWGEIWKLGVAYDTKGKPYAKGWISSARIVNAEIETKSHLRS
jgi:hypothetical protein